jgi:hypothetical protein
MGAFLVAGGPGWLLVPWIMAEQHAWRFKECPRKKRRGLRRYFGACKVDGACQTIARKVLTSNRKKGVSC